MPGAAAQGNLERIVAGGSCGIDLVDDAEIRKLGEVGPRRLLITECVSIHRHGRWVLVAARGILIDVLQYEVMAANGAGIADVQLPRVA